MKDQRLVDENSIARQARIPFDLTRRDPRQRKTSCKHVARYEFPFPSTSLTH